jgi:phage terminase large subunit-like protein
MPKSQKTSSPRSRQKSRPSSARKQTVAPAFSYVAVANQYARDVVAGRILACKWVRLACQRHLNDLAKSKKRWHYRFDERKACRACEFIEALPHTKGEWASRGETIKLQPWQVFVICVIFGWVKIANGMRRFTLAYICVPRKNGKSIIGGGIGNYMLAADGEFGAEVYSGATTEKQAWEVFLPAKQMVERTADLQEAFGIEVGAKRLFVQANGSRFEPVIGNPGDGASPHCGIVDEYHEHGDDALFDTFRTGMGARRQPLLLVITTAGDNLMGPCKALQGDVEKILEGTIERDEMFGIVYTIDGGVDWTSNAALRMANPNYDVSVFGEFLETEQRAAIKNSRKQGIFQTKHLNVWVGANAAYFNVQRWNELADPSLDPDEFRGLPCVVCVDLSTKIDITARVLIFKKQQDGKDHFYVFTRPYLPEERAMAPEYQHYQQWVRDGHLRTTPGPRIDYELIQSETIEDVRRFKAREICYDPWNAEQLAQAVEKATQATAVEVPQRAAFLSDPMKQLEAAIAEGRVHHEGNLAMAAAIGNVVAHEDAKSEVFPRKERDDNFIDPAVALITGFRRALVIPHAANRSVYSERGIRVL